MAANHPDQQAASEHFQVSSRSPSSKVIALVLLWYKNGIRLPETKAPPNTFGFNSVDYKCVQR